MKQLLINKTSESNNISYKTYIDSNLLPFTREFNNKEINEWMEEDSLE